MVCVDDLVNPLGPAAPGEEGDGASGQHDAPSEGDGQVLAGGEVDARRCDECAAPLRFSLGGQEARTPYTLHPTPYNLHPSPYTLHPKTNTLIHSPYTLHRSPFTQHPTPYPLKPTTLIHSPVTLNPKPGTPKPRRACRRGSIPSRCAVQHAARPGWRASMH